MRDLTKTSFRAKKAQVIVERQRPKRNSARFEGSRFDRVAEDSTAEEQHQQQQQIKEPDLLEVSTFFSVRAAQENLASISEGTAEPDAATNIDDENGDSKDSEQEELENEKKLELLRCKHCRWPKAASHLEPLNSSQVNQLKWIEENLTTSFFENIDLIEERAFKYSLWSMFLKCLAFKRQIDDYITCCMLLDDVRLLDIEQLVIICSGEDEMMNLLLAQLNRKMEIQEKTDAAKSQPGNKTRGYCLKCEKEYDDEMLLVATEDGSDTNNTEQVENQMLDVRCAVDKEFCFSLANLFNQFIKRNNSNIRKMVAHFLNYGQLLNKSEIPISLYLKAIENTINRSRRIKRSPLLNQDSTFWSSNKTL